MVNCGAMWAKDTLGERKERKAEFTISSMYLDCFHFAGLLQDPYFFFLNDQAKLNIRSLELHSSNRPLNTPH